jgi:hypothetical protein
MKKKLFIAVFLLSITAKMFGQVEGIVIDKKKIAITNVVIAIRDTTGKSIDTVLSDKRGSYALKGLKPG